MNIKLRRWHALAIAITCMISSVSRAAPMGFKDSWMSMGDFGSNWQELSFNYALTPRDALGGSFTHMRSDDKQQSLELVDATYTHLLKRWNMKHAQSNLWFIGGVGAAKIRDHAEGVSQSKPMVSPGVQWDYETTRLYFSTLGRLYRAEGVNHDYGAVRTGFSFYETEYTQTQPWFIVEARRMHDLSDKTEITPMLRFINKDYFIEAGVNNSHQVRFNFMYIF